MQVRVFDRAHAYEIMREGVDQVYREVFGSSMDLAKDALTALGRHPHESERAIRLFRKHDEKMLRKAATLMDDESKLIDLAKQSRAEITRVFASDRGEEKPKDDTAWHDEDGERQ